VVQIIGLVWLRRSFGRDTNRDDTRLNMGWRMCFAFVYEASLELEEMC
jgi:hypothetical protein